MDSGRDAGDLLCHQACDEDKRYLIRQLAKDENRLLTFAAATLLYPDYNTRWQTVERLSKVFSRRQDAEALLLKFIEDDHEYVRRAPMNQLGQIGSSHRTNVE